MGHARRVLQSPRRPVPSLRGRRLPRRLIQLYAGLALYGVSMALIIRSALGNMPWDVLHQGLAGRIGWSIGTVSILVGALVLLAWIPLRQRPGLGTVSNVVVIGLAVDATLAVVPAPSSLPLRVGLLVAGVLLNAVATAAYIGVHLGPGPRDGLMTGLVAPHRRVGAAGAHVHRGRRRRHRLAARRHAGAGHRPLRGRDRPAGAGPAPPAVAQPPRPGDAPLRADLLDLRHARQKQQTNIHHILNNTNKINLKIK